KCIF
ncbi:hypothetical protein D031_2310B, partial [Vibrio parahaemolyticus VP-48]